MAKELIEDKGMRFKLYELENGELELCIPESTPPGYDVIYILNQKEITDYRKRGSATLQERIAHMKANFREYKLHSWR